MDKLKSKAEVQEFFRQYSDRSLLRFSTIGSVDDGKSTLIGRLLHDTKNIAEDHVSALVKATKMEVEDSPLDFALVTDGLQAEREQGITIDVAYRYFSTPKRNFIIADTPGHEQYTRNMATGASTANLAIILIDARAGVVAQTKRHSFITSLLGIPRLLVLINKMDLVDYSEEVFRKIREDYSNFAQRLGVLELKFIPISALKGDNVVVNGKNMPWYEGESVLSYLENVYVGIDRNVVDFRFPVQYVLRPSGNFRGFAGEVASGRVRVGEEVMVLPSMRRSKVKSIETFDGPLEEAHAAQSVTLVLEDEVDVSRGDMLVRPNNVPRVEDHFEAMVVWMNDKPMKAGDTYIVQHTTHRTKAIVQSLQYRVNVNTLSREEDEPSLELNQIGRVALHTTSPIYFDPYTRNRATGNLILVDPNTNDTMGAGMIIERVPARVLKEQDEQLKARNIHRHEGQVLHSERAARLDQQARTIWFTGYSASGKSTIACQLERRLFDAGKIVYRLDGDNVRSGLNGDLGFTKEDRAENIRRVAEVAHLMNDCGIIVIVALISPYRRERAKAREIIGDSRFTEIHVSTPLSVCVERDPKQLYKKAKDGKVANFTGVSDIYEDPQNPALTLDTSEKDVESCVEQVLRLLGV